MILNKKLENYWLILQSLPSWECGLKSFYTPIDEQDSQGRSLRGSVDWNLSDKKFVNAITVAPFVGVWIEIDTAGTLIPIFLSRSLRGSVDWNLVGIKAAYLQLSRSLRGSVDWNGWGRVLDYIGVRCRSLRGSVDWNKLGQVKNEGGIVAPFVGVWIEMFTTYESCYNLRVAPFVGVWIEIGKSMCNGDTVECRSLRGSVDWNYLQSIK